MKKFIVKNKKDDSIIGTFDSKREASEFVTGAIDDNLIDTVFDVACEGRDIEDYPLTFSDACKFLGIPESAIALKGDNGTAKAAVAFYKLCIIAKSWNKADDFTPDFSSRSQKKWHPYFVYDANHAGFKLKDSADVYMPEAVCSRLCFRTYTRACQFGEHFIGLWNDVLSF